MTLTCAQSEEHLLESLDDRLSDDVRRTVDRHLATCARCAAFAVQLRAVDARLAAALPAAMPPASLPEGVRARIRRERRAAFNEILPDVIHLAGCSVATILCAALLPIDAAITVGAGIGVTCVTYVFMAVMRWSIEVTGQPDW